MESLILLFLIVVLLILWSMATHRKLAAMDENVCNAMSQIGVQISSRFDVLLTLVNLTGDYDEQETRILLEKAKAGRMTVNGQSTPEEVRGQELLIAETLDRVSALAEWYSELKEEKEYGKCMDAVDSYEKMISTSSLIYNDSAMKMNRAIRLFPTNLIAGVLGFHQKEYLETLENIHINK